MFLSLSALKLSRISPCLTFALKDFQLDKAYRGICFNLLSSYRRAPFILFPFPKIL